MRLSTLAPPVLYASVGVRAVTYTVPASAPASAAPLDPSLVSVSIEFFAFPLYAALAATTHCLANLAALRGGAPPAVRIGGTTQYVVSLGAERAV